MIHDDIKDKLHLLKPNEYYFQQVRDDDEDIFLITPKEYFDTNGCLPDLYMPQQAFPPGFYELCDATFEYDGDSAKGRDLLLAAGFIELKMFDE